MKTDTGNLAVLISGVVVNSLCGIAAAAVEGLFIEISYFDTALLLCYRRKNVHNR